MNILDKLLPRFADECQRFNSDQWRLVLTNGYSLTVSARRDEDFLRLDADSGISAAAKSLLSLAEVSCRPAAVKFALRRGSPRIRLRSEFPLPEENAALADRIREHLDAMRRALHRLDDGVACEADGEEATCPGSLTALLDEAGWQYYERPGGALLADLEAGSRFLQAEIEHCGAGVRFRVTLYRGEGEATRQALCLYLLEANAALCYARGFLQREGDSMSAGFEVYIESAPVAAEVGHALGALSVAGRYCATEMDVLMNDGSLAEIYRSARPIFEYQSKGA